MTRIDTIDISHYQGAVDWAKVKAATGGHLAIWKMSQGRSFIDRYQQANRVATREAGFTHRLMYHWVTPTHTANEQVAHLLGTAGQLATGEGIMLDVEQGGVTLELAIAVARQTEMATGRPVAIYTGRYVDGGRIWRSTDLFDGRRPRIFAAYIPEARAAAIAAPFKWDLWQFTSKATVDGVNTLVDANRLDNPPIFDSVCGLNPATTFPATIRTEDDTMGALFQADDGDPAVYVTSAGICRWVRNGYELDVLRYCGQATMQAPVKIARAGFKYFQLVGPAPTYSVTHSGVRTVAGDFASPTN